MQARIRQLAYRKKREIEFRNFRIQTFRRGKVSLPHGNLGLWAEDHECIRLWVDTNVFLIYEE